MMEATGTTDTAEGRPAAEAPTSAPRHRTIHQRNDGLKKRCRCQRRNWAKCPHAWHFGFQYGGKEHRVSLHRYAGKPPGYCMLKTEAESLRDKLRSEIRGGTYVDPAAGPTKLPNVALTFADIADRYIEEHVRDPKHRVGGQKLMEMHVKLLRAVQVPAAGGRPIALGLKPLDTITTADVEAVRRAVRDHMPRAKGGAAGANRTLSRLRHLFNWAIRLGYTERTPFRRGGVTMIHLDSRAETPRSRRLLPGEEEKLLMTARPALRHLIVAALETGCRLGELLSMQWHQVRWAENLILIDASKAKTNEARGIPMTARLRAILEMRQHDPAGELFGPQAYVFGNSVGEQVRSIRKGWDLARKRASVEDLHFHDLRREFASRLMESGAADHDVRDWLGHANITTTSRYLSSSTFRRQAVLKQFEAARPGPA